MISIQEYMKKYRIKREKTVLKWLENGYITGAVQDKDVWYIPDSAHEPYVNRRAKTESSIYVSIVRGCNKMKDVNAKLYGLSDHEFHNYIRNLIGANLICKDLAIVPHKF